jgi:hypothetical protein
LCFKNVQIIIIIIIMRNSTEGNVGLKVAAGADGDNEEPLLTAIAGSADAGVLPLFGLVFTPGVVAVRPQNHLLFALGVSLFNWYLHPLSG